MTQREAGRLVFREDGDMLKCYLAPPSTMDGAVLIGSVHLRAVHMKQSRREQFTRLMKAVYKDMLTELGAKVAGWSDKERKP